MWDYVKHTGNIYEHRAIAEAALGRPLPDSAEVHQKGLL